MKSYVLTFVILFSLCGFSQEQTAQYAEYADSLMSSSYKENSPGAVLLVAENGKPIIKKAYGMANLALKIPVKTGDIFAIGSMSKQFTAVCILKLAEEGKLSLSDDIKKYLPEYNNHGRKITIENLLTHTSGITSYTEKNDFIKDMTIDFSKAEIEKYFMNDSLLFEPGTDWSYSNSGFFLAALIVEKASRMPLEEFMQKNIFDPAGMTNTYFGTRDSVIPGFVTGYDMIGENKYREGAYLSWNWPFGAGQLLSNVDDMLKWDEALYTNKIVSFEWLKKAWTNFYLPNGQVTNYGFGWVLSTYKNVEIIRHGGAINGYLCDAIRIPSKHLYSVILSNFTGVNPGNLNEKIALHYADLPFKTPPIITLTPDALKELTGVFEIHREGSRITTNSSKEKFYRYITEKNDTLYSQNTGSSKYPIFNVGKDLFVYQGSNTYLKFIRSLDNKINSVNIFSEPTNYGPIENEIKTNIPLPSEKEEIKMTAEQLNKYIGTYDLGGGFNIKIYLENDKIFGRATGQGPFELFPENEKRFFIKVVDASIDFEFDNNGKITGFILHQGGDYKAKKIE